MKIKKMCCYSIFRYFFRKFLLIIVLDVVKTYYLILFGSQHIAACFQEASTRHQYVKGWHRVMLVPEVHLRNPFSSFFSNLVVTFQNLFSSKRIILECNLPYFSNRRWIGILDHTKLQFCHEFITNWSL